MKAHRPPERLRGPCTENSRLAVLMNGAMVRGRSLPVNRAILQPGSHRQVRLRTEQHASGVGLKMRKQLLAFTILVWAVCPMLADEKTSHATIVGEKSVDCGTSVKGK